MHWYRLDMIYFVHAVPLHDHLISQGYLVKKRFMALHDSMELHQFSYMTISQGYLAFGIISVRT
jgi:hypothetical protein